MNLVKRKFREDGKTFSPSMVFKNANRIFNEWDEDLLRLTKSRPSFKEVMRTLTEFFKYKKHKEKLKGLRNKKR